MRIVLAIHPEHAEAILNGTKRYEYRKTFPRITSPAGVTVLLYATAPVQRVVGEFEARETVRGWLENVWRTTHSESGITWEDFASYYADRDRAIAIRVTQSERYPHPRTLKDVTGWTTPPQSYRYLHERGEP